MQWKAIKLFKYSKITIIGTNSKYLTKSFNYNKIRSSKKRMSYYNKFSSKKNELSIFQAQLNKLNSNYNSSNLRVSINQII